VIVTQLDPRQAMVACLDQWRDSIVGYSDAGLLDQVRGIESVSRMLYSVMLDAVAELESRNIAATSGFGTTKGLLAGMLHLSATEARTRVAHAVQLAPRRTLNGEVLPPTLPNTAAALAAGQIGPAQVRVITETMTAIPASVPVTDRDAAEADLARYARSFDPTPLHKIGRHLLAHLDPDGPPPRNDQDPAPAAGELRFWERRNGRLGLEGFLEPEHSAAFRALIEQLAAPRPAAEGLPDARTTPQRNADALLEICGLARAAQHCPTTAGEPPHLTVTIDWDALRTGLGAPDWGHRTGGTGLGDRDPRLRHPPQRRRRPTLGIRRENHPPRPRRQLRTTRRRPSHAHRPTVHPPSTHRPRPRMRIPRLRPTTRNVPSPPLSTLDRRRRHLRGELRSSLRDPSSPRAQYRLGNPHPPQSRRLHSTSDHRPDPHTTAQPAVQDYSGDDAPPGLR
jgi:uncharacterized protein DUF222